MIDKRKTFITKSICRSELGGQTSEVGKGMTNKINRIDITVIGLVSLFSLIANIMIVL